MKTSKHLVTIFSLITAVCLSTTANAHGIWFAQRAGELAMIYGDGGKDDPIIPKIDKIKHVTGYDASGQPVPSPLVKTDYLLLVDRSANPSVVTAILDNGYYTQDSNGKWVAKGKSEVANATKSGRYFKLAIHQITDLEKPLSALPNHPLQITPIQARLPKQKGDAITLRVLFNGKPIAGIKVSPDFANDPDGPQLKTDRDGLVRLKVPNQGLNVIYAKHEVSAVGEDANIVQYAASFSFLLKPKED